ncbi:MAG: hypothetical protein P4L34_07295 [Paludibacter sp.]|nr:hypothetical protein [Paludibacter sp.]
MRKSDKHFIGIGFWAGGGVFSIINIFKILTHANILSYDYIMTGIAVIFILLSLILLRKRNKGDHANAKDKYDIGYKFGIGFWVGGGIYSFINLLMNLKNAPQSNILFYNYFIIAVVVIGLILNITLLLKRQHKEE